MEECLAIKPDLIFLWDEAWFAFAGFTPTYRRRTAMATARRLQARYRSAEYAEEYEAYKKRIARLKDDALINERLYPDPDCVRIRTYATQSTHKSLTSLRQGSMIHIYDQDFDRDSNTIEVFVNRIRKKLEVDIIQTVRGMGYRITDPDQEA